MIDIEMKIAAYFLAGRHCLFVSDDGKDVVYELIAARPGLYHWTVQGSDKLSGKFDSIVLTGGYDTVAYCDLSSKLAKMARYSLVIVVPSGWNASYFHALFNDYFHIILSARDRMYVVVKPSIDKDDMRAWNDFAEQCQTLFHQCVQLGENNG